MLTTLLSLKQPVANTIPGFANLVFSNSTYTEVLYSNTANTWNGWAYTGGASNSTSIYANGAISLFANNIPRITTNGLLIEANATNLAWYSMNGVSAAGAGGGSSLSSPNTCNTGQADPLGGTTAIRVLGAGGASQFNAWNWNGNNLAYTSGKVYTASYWIKYGNWQYIQMTFPSSAFGSHYVNFDLVAGAVVASSGATGTITSEAGGWYKITFTDTATSSTTAHPGAVTFVSSSSATYQPNATVSTSSYFYLWGYQVEQSSSASSLINTAGASGSRTQDVLNITYNPVGSNALIMIANSANTLALANVYITPTSPLSINATALSSNSSYIQSIIINNGTSNTLIYAFSAPTSNVLVSNISMVTNFIYSGGATNATAIAANGLVQYFANNSPRVTNLGMLIEPSANQYLNDTTINATGNTQWTLYHSATSSNATSIVDPSGSNNAILLTIPAQSQSTHGGITPTLTTPQYTSGTYCASVWAMANSGTQAFAFSWYDENAGAYQISSNNYTANTTWQRFYWSYTVGTGGTYVNGPSDMWEVMTPSTGAAVSLYLWGPQVELGTTPSSFIPQTAGSGPKTRTADATTFTFQQTGNVALVTYSNTSTANPSATSPLNLGANSGAAWVSKYINSVTIR